MADPDWAAWRVAVVALLGDRDTRTPGRLDPAAPPRPLDIPRLLEVLDRNDVTFVVDGSGALLLEGVPLVPGDLDIVVATDTDNLAKLSKVLNDLDAIPRATDWEHSLTADEARRWVPRPDAPPSFDHDFATSAGVLDVVWITGSYDTLAGSARLVHHHDLPVRVVDTSALRHRMNNSDRIKDRVRTAAIDGRIDGIEVVLAGRREVVVAKPAGVAAEMRADVDGVSLLERIRRNGWPEARLPHRLDRVSSGLQVVAWDAAAVADHNRTIASGGWTKRYIARIDRRHADDPAALLGEHRRHLRREGRVARVVRSGGKPSVLIVEEVAPDPVRADCAQVAVRLLTGRYHQVRAMLADLGAPLVGDDRYGGRDDPDGPWLEQVELTLPLVGLPGTQRIVLPEHCRRFDVAPAIMDGLLHRRPHRQASDGTSHRST